MDLVPTCGLIRILCLHGYGQNGTIFKEKLGGFRKFFKNRAEFFFIDGPHRVNKGNEENDIGERAWCLRKDGDESSREWDRETYETSFQYVADYYATNGPFDGLLGFSQGAEFAAMLCSLPTYKFKFVILVAGLKARIPEYSVYYEKEIKIPSLHIIGENDKIIVRSRSEDLRNCFCSNLSETLIHEGGHYVPNKKMFKDTCISFVQKSLDKSNSSQGVMVT